MRLEDFQFLDNEPFDNSIKKRFFKSIPPTRSTINSTRSTY